MALSDWATLAGLVSSLGVVISLIYLGMQIRQSSRHQRASMQQGRAARTVDILLRTAEPDIASVILRGRMADPAIEAFELEQFLRAATAIFVSFEDGYVLRCSGMLDAATIAGDEAALKMHILPWPGYRVAWEMLKAGMQPDFRAYVDSLAREVQPTSSSDRLAQWKTLAVKS